MFPEACWCEGDGGHAAQRRAGEGFPRYLEQSPEVAGVPGWLFRDPRRTTARNLRRAGIVEGVIMKIGGWRTRGVFE